MNSCNSSRVDGGKVDTCVIDSKYGEILWWGLMTPEVMKRTYKSKDEEYVE